MPLFPPEEVEYQLEVLTATVEAGFIERCKSCWSDKTKFAGERSPTRKELVICVQLRIIKRTLFSYMNGLIAVNKRQLWQRQRMRLLPLLFLLLSLVRLTILGIA